jgi:hypothetical protein
MILASLACALLVLATVYAAIVSFHEKAEGTLPSWFFPEGSGRSFRVSVGVATVMLLVAAAAWFSISARHATPRSLRFFIPEGYSGWVRVEFEVPGAPALQSGAGQTALEIPSSGILQTSSPEQYGWARDYYYFRSSSGLRTIPDSGPTRLIWGKINGQASGSSGRRKYEEFFVGTEQQYRDQTKGR